MCGEACGKTRQRKQPRERRMNRLTCSTGIIALIGSLLLANSASATTIKAAQYQLAITRYSNDTGLTFIGTGFFRYDRGSVDQQVSDWTAQWDACFGGDDSACEGLDTKLDVQFPLIAAGFDMHGHAFVDDDIQWTERFGYEDGHL